MYVDLRRSACVRVGAGDGWGEGTHLAMAASRMALAPRAPASPSLFLVIRMTWCGGNGGRGGGGVEWGGIIIR